MYLINTGDIFVTREKNVEKVANFLTDHNIDFEEMRRNDNSKEIAFSIDENHGDIEDDLKALITFCNAQNIEIRFDIRYSGDDVGGYTYKTGDEEMQYLDETDIAIADAGDDCLIDACKRRGLWPNEEEIYRKVQHEYLLEDAENHLEEILERDENYSLRTSTALCGDRKKFLEEAVRLYEKYKDCDIAENATWECLIEDLLERRRNI